MFGKKKYQKNVARDNEFLRNYEVKINGLLPFVQSNSKITDALKELQEQFHYTVPSPHKDAKSYEQEIEKEYATLEKAVEQPALDETLILFSIHKINKQIENINASRRA